MDVSIENTKVLNWVTRLLIWGKNEMIYYRLYAFKVETNFKI